MNEFLQWLTKELAESETAFSNAEVSEILSGYEIDATMERKYWAGYVDALTNVLNEYAGPGDTN